MYNLKSISGIDSCYLIHLEVLVTVFESQLLRIPENRIRCVHTRVHWTRSLSYEYNMDIYALCTLALNGSPSKCKSKAVSKNFFREGPKHVYFNFIEFRF
jgi:hypothetical protein